MISQPGNTSILRCITASIISLISTSSACWIFDRISSVFITLNSVYQICIAFVMHISETNCRKIEAIQMYCEVIMMGRFQIPNTPPTINKTIRFPSDVVEEVEKAIQGKECTFSAFVIAAVRAALEDLKEE